MIGRIIAGIYLFAIIEFLPVMGVHLGYEEQDWPVGFAYSLVAILAFTLVHEAGHLAAGLAMGRSDAPRSRTRDTPRS